MEKFKTLLPPMFVEEGEACTVGEAVSKSAWIATVNLWLIKTSPEPAILYQQRSLTRKWSPGKLDVVVGGKVDHGESIFEGLKRECHEEIKLDITENECTYIGKRLAVGTIPAGFLYTVPHIYFKQESRELVSFSLQEEEVSGIFELKLKDLLDLYAGKISEFVVTGLNPQKEEYSITVNASIFPENMDNYHKKIALLVNDWVNGKRVEY